MYVKERWQILNCIKFNQKNKSKILLFLLLSSVSIWVIFYFMKDGVTGNDYWWHVKTGEWIVKNHVVPKYDIFSWYGKEHHIKWIPHEWLSDVIFFWIFKFLGNNGIFVFSVLMAIAFEIMVLSEIKAYVKKNLVIGGIFLIFFTTVITAFFYPRPHIFSYFLLFFEFKILYIFINNEDTKLIYIIPLIGILWSNLHGGSAMLSYTMCIVVFVSSLIKSNNDRLEYLRLKKKNSAKMLIVIILTVCGILINPIGIDVLLYPFLNQSDKLMISVIAEWQSPDIKDIGQLIIYYIPIILIAYEFILYRKNIHIIDILFTGLFLYLFLRSVRFIILWYICAMFSQMKYVKQLKLKSYNEKIENIMVIFLILVVWSINTSYFIESIKNIQENLLIKNEISDEMIDFIKKDSPKRLFNDYDFGGELIYNEVPVFFDSRADLYSQDNIMNDGMSLLFLESFSKDDDYINIEQKMQQYHFDAIYVKKQRALYSYMMNNTNKYQKVNEDSNSGYFYRLK